MSYLPAAALTRAYTLPSSCDGTGESAGLPRVGGAGVSAMLVLRLKPNEALTIGADVRIVVTALDGGSVTLGIDAPIDVRVRRSRRARGDRAALQRDGDVSG